MQPVLNVEDIKRVEVSLTRVGVSVSELMHRAGYAAAQEVLNLGGSIDNVVVLAGMGNNGGDGWVAAEALRSRNVNVKVITPIEPDQISGDLARQMAQRAVRSGVSVLVGPPKTELADLLSTTFFLMPIDEVINYVDSREDFDVLIVDKDMNIITSKNFKYEEVKK